MNFPPIILLIIGIIAIFEPLIFDFQIIISQEENGDQEEAIVTKSLKSLWNLENADSYFQIIGGFILAGGLALIGKSYRSRDEVGNPITTKWFFEALFGIDEDY